MQTNSVLLFLSKGKKPDPVSRKVTMTKQVADGIITYSKSWHPNEGILILKGRSKKQQIIIEGLVIPPFSTHGPYYSGFPTYDLPFDLSYVGTAHSHPGGSNRPSLEDLNNYYGVISIIINYPYEYNTIGAFDRNGVAMDLEFVDVI
ncbi:MAG: Mov34/MPN/PAD-1 family protein [Thermoproteota archaeon]|jgi:proteasome lid subunit RPN8/RPN11|nr:Mov34/MPN/PAD-1 family protein [Thermoproteota archaeon]